MKIEVTGEQQKYVQEMARMCEQTFGLPRMGGRVWGMLLITEKEALSAEELMDAIGASRGSVSTMVRLLERIGLVKRVTVRGERRHYYQVAEPEALMHTELGSIKLFINMMANGLKLIERDNVHARQRLDDLHGLMLFFEKEYSALLERWQQQKAER